MLRQLRARIERDIAGLQRKIVAIDELLETPPPRSLGKNYRERLAIKRKRKRWVSRFSSQPLPVQEALLSDLTTVLRSRPPEVHLLNPSRPKSVPAESSALTEN